jgi:hypothetical protein
MIERSRQSPDRRFGGFRREMKWIEAHDDRGVCRDRAPLTLCVPCVGEGASTSRERVVDSVA